MTQSFMGDFSFYSNIMKKVAQVDAKKGIEMTLAID